MKSKLAALLFAIVILIGCQSPRVEFVDTMDAGHKAISSWAYDALEFMKDNGLDPDIAELRSTAITAMGDAIDEEIEALNSEKNSKGEIKEAAKIAIKEIATEATKAAINAAKEKIGE